MFNVAPKSAQNALRSQRSHALEIQRRERSHGFSVSGIGPRDFLSFNLVTLTFVVFFLVKISLVGSYGVEGYAERLELFAGGTSVEQFAGRLLAIDPITAAASKILGIYQ